MKPENQDSFRILGKIRRKLLTFCHISLKIVSKVATCFGKPVMINLKKKKKPLFKNVTDNAFSIHSSFLFVLLSSSYSDVQPGIKGITWKDLAQLLLG